MGECGKKIEEFDGDHGDGDEEQEEEEVDRTRKLKRNVLQQQQLPPLHQWLAHATTDANCAHVSVVEFQ
jgi:hypothetical protein